MNSGRDLHTRWQHVPHPRLLVVGDLMLDRYTLGEAERISPEAPVLVLRGEEEDVRLGGAANVGSFLRGLEAAVTLCGAVGNDSEGRTLRRLLEEAGIEAEGVLTVDDRPTTSKQRFVGRTSAKAPQQLLRVDRESRAPLTEQVENQLLDAIERHLTECDAVLISDYAKGVCTPDLGRATIAAARRAGRPVLVDPCRETDYTRYAGATLLAPNRVAAELLTRRTLRDSDVILSAVKEWRERLQVDTLVITLDRDGLAFATTDTAEIVAGRPRAICDVTGAGDMVLAMLGLCAAADVPLRESLELANTAAGLEVERFAVEPITRAEIAAELRSPLPDDKLVTLEQAAVHVARHRRADQSVVFTNGCFDLLHVGHVTLLHEAARLGDVLVVAINSDAGVRRLKGCDRPVIGEQDRARMLAALECVDHVLIFDDDTPHRLLEALRPDVLVKGGTTADIVGREVVAAYGGRVCRTARVDDWSTTALVQRMRKPFMSIAEEVA